MSDMTVFVVIYVVLPVLFVAGGVVALFGPDWLRDL